MQAVGVAPEPVCPLAQPGLLGRQAGRRLGQLPAADVEPGVALVGRVGGLCPPRGQALQPGGLPLELDPARGLGSEVAVGRLACGLTAAALVGQPVAVGGGRSGRVGRGELTRADVREGGLCDLIEPGRLLCLGTGAVGRLGGGGMLRRRRGVLGRQVVALGSGRKPRRLPGIAGAPQLSAVGVDALAGARHGHAVLDLGEIVHEPHSLEQPPGDGVEHRDDLDQRPGSGRGWQRRRGRARVGEHHRHLSPGLGQHRQRVGQALGHHGPCPPAEAGGDRALVAGLCLDAGDHELGAGRFERAHGGRQPLAPIERLLERLEARAHHLVAMAELVRGGPRRPVSVGGAVRIGPRPFGGGGGGFEPGLQSDRRSVQAPGRLGGPHQATGSIRGRRGQACQAGTQLVGPGGAAVCFEAGGARMSLRLGESSARVERCREGRFGRGRRLPRLAGVDRGEPVGLGQACRSLLGCLRGLGRKPLGIGPQAVGLGRRAQLSPAEGGRSLLEPAAGGGQPLAPRLEVVVAAAGALLLCSEAGQLHLGPRAALADGGQMGIHLGLGGAGRLEACPGRIRAQLLAKGVGGEQPQPAGGDLRAQPSGPVGRRRLHLQRPQPRPHLALEVTGALELGADPGELQPPLGCAGAGTCPGRRPPRRSGAARGAWT